MTAVAVPRVFVNDAKSKIVSSVIGSAGAGNPSSPGSPASLREPYAWWRAMLPACPITTTAPGSLFAAIASLISLETLAKSGAGVAPGGLGGVAKPGMGGAAGTWVVIGLSLNVVCAVSPREQAKTTARQTIPTAEAFRMAFRIG